MSKNEKSQRDAILEAAEEGFDEIYDDLVNHKPRGKIPEPIFRDYFLPYFSGEVPLEKDSGIIINWVSIAGTPVSEVEVVNGNGEVEFTVPPIFNTNIINPSRTDDNSITEIYSNYLLKSNNLPAEGEKYLNKSLSEKVNNLTEADQEYANRWKEILDRYGKTAIQEENTATSIPEDDIDFDD